jgi:ferric-dicitrate binding protein FerR (iron transport regulator)
VIDRGGNLLWPGSLLLALGLCLGGGCGDTPAGDWVARLEAVAGSVEVVEAPGRAPRDGRVGLFLRVGAELRTGADSRAVLVLRNGGRLTVQPGSLVQFASEAPERQLRVGLRSGSVIGSASVVAASMLVIGFGARWVHLTPAAAAQVTARERQEDSTILVTYGEAQVEGPEGKRRVVEGETFTFAPSRRPDAGVKKAEPRLEVQAPALVLFLEASGRGRVLVRAPGQRRFVALRKGIPVEIKPGTEVMVERGARVSVGSEKGKATLLTGPAQVKLVEAPGQKDGKPTVKLESLGSTMHLAATGEAGTRAAPFELDGVKVTPRVAYRRLEVRTRKERGRSLVSVISGEALLEGASRRLLLEAGQEAVLQAGDISGPHGPPPAALEVRAPGAMRVFTASLSIPVSFRWQAGKHGALVEIGPPDRPLFSDVIRRSLLTLPQLPRGTHRWRVRLIDENGVPEARGLEGRLLLVKDTSYRSLKDRQAPRNMIHESYGNTTVYYQNVLPRFIFRWEPMGSDARYQMKVYREQALGTPVFTAETRQSELSVPGSKLGEGTFLWYVAGRQPDGTLIRSTSSRKLTIRYDNATPDLQIIYPQNGLHVEEPTLETRGVTIPGSRVTINGVRAELDETYRFSHSVKLKPGSNLIIYLVTDRRRGASYYLREVTRK